MTAKKFIRSAAHLPVNNLRETLDYYQNVLGFSEEWIMGKDGGVHRDEMRLLFSEDPGFVKDMNNQQHRLPLLWFVQNIDDIFSEFQQREIEIVNALRQHPYGLREFAFIDLNGYYVRIAEPVS